MSVRLNLRQLRVFQEIMRGGSAIVAADALNISQPAVSKLLTTMELDLRYSLFTRTGRGLEPTAEAISLYPYVERTLAEHQRLQHHAQNLRTGSSGLIRIAGNMTLINILAARSVVRFRTDFPELTVELMVMPGAEVQTALATRKADIGLLYGPNYSDIIPSEQIGSWPVLCALRPDHPLAAREEVHIRELGDEKILTYSATTPTGLAVRRAFENSGTTFRSSMSLPNTPGVLEMVQSGMGVGLVDHWQHWRSYFPDVVCRPVLPKIENTIQMIVAPHGQTSGSIRKMAALLKELATELRDNA